eukprot:CAMPEP_0204898444 /NCGR_PEP_ID=MMETSP1397-20131031/1293_1 /ASSEMBLY_ACC=CAM_ASM_000891 /TAXON_ID=49980 /ORGANISM="Climacostomum Climacostomum virens, Strain Stock W-24" /LENGTH=235 /DNA_ID=CAMNT_0052066295 /DNA_START=1166 /DNA_END=1873 /DNA_ORIENTATION=+
MIDELIKEMLQAAEDDDKANLDSLPALNKLKMLNRVVQFLKVVKFHETFLAMEGCVILSRWLSPLPDGSIPCNMIRQNILEALQELPITTDNLQHSELGKQVMAIYKNPSESAAMKKMAKTLIDKWSRAIYDISIDYTALEDSERHNDMKASRVRESNMHKVIAQDQPTNYIRIPQRGMHDYKHRPVSRLSQQEEKQDQDASALQRLQKKMLKRKRPSNKKPTGMMSADGRGLLF